MSTSIINGLLGLFRGILPWARDERVRTLMQAAASLQQLLDEMDSTINRMEQRYRELARKAEEALSSKNKLEHDSFIQEMEEVNKYITLVYTMRQNIFKVKLRIDTIINMGTGLEQLPQVIREIQAIKELLEPVVPQLATELSQVEQQVSRVLAATSVPDTLVPSAKPGSSGRGAVDEAAGYRDLLPPRTQPVTRQAEAKAATRVVSKSVVKKWLLHELSMTQVLDIRGFTAKYRVPRSLVLEALYELEKEGRIKLVRD